MSDGRVVLLGDEVRIRPHRPVRIVFASGLRLLEQRVDGLASRAPWFRLVGPRLQALPQVLERCHATLRGQHHAERVGDLTQLFAFGRAAIEECLESRGIAQTCSILQDQRGQLNARVRTGHIHRQRP